MTSKKQPDVNEIAAAVVALALTRFRNEIAARREAAPLSPLIVDEALAATIASLTLGENN